MHSLYLAAKNPQYVWIKCSGFEKTISVPQSGRIIISQTIPSGRDVCIAHQQGQLLTSHPLLLRKNALNI